MDFYWRKKRDAKKRKGSSTPGKMKGSNCQATPLDKWMASKSRSYKHPEYATWMKKKNGYVQSSK